MIYVSTASQPINFSIAGKPYTVQPGGEVNVPERFAYALKGLPLLLKPGQPVEAPPDEETMEVWRERAKQIAKRAEADMAALRRQVEDMGADLTVAIARADEASATLATIIEERKAEREAYDGFATQLRDALGIAPGASIISAIEGLKDMATRPADKPAEKPPEPKPQSKPR